MKKLFCKLPPLQWAAILSALISSALLTLAMLLEFDLNSNYFVRDARLPTVALSFAFLSVALSIATSILSVRKKRAVRYPSELRKLHVFPAIGFLAALAGSICLLWQKGSALWDHHHSGFNFFEEFLTLDVKIALASIPLLICAAVYCLCWAFSDPKRSMQTSVWGFAAIIACALMSVHLYFDFSVEINAPIKSLLLGGFLCSMILFTTELRLPLKKPIPVLLWAVSGFSLASAALCFPAIPVAFFTGCTGRLDFLFCGIFHLCMLPVAIEHLLSFTAPESRDPDQTERTDRI